MHFGALWVAVLIDTSQFPVKHHENPGIKLTVPLEICQRPLE